MIRLLICLYIVLSSSYSVIADELKKCEWDNRDGDPCITISKTPNTSEYNLNSINKIVITKQDIRNSGATDTIDILNMIPGLDLFQSGQKGQQTSLFTRGSESNHTLVLINGVPINDQSVTDGLHDFGQDFVQTIQNIEIYKGPSGAHFGPSAISGAINFVTDIDYENSLNFNGFDSENNSIDGNFTKITNNDWHLNIKGATNNNKTNSAIADGNEDDQSFNIQANVNAVKWINDNLKFKSTLYSRKTKTDYDGSSSDEIGYVADNKMYTFQNVLEHKTKSSENNLVVHYHNYDREYENGGYLDEYYSESIFLKGERKTTFTDNLSFGFGTEYKYDWGYFENRGSYNASTKGHMKDLGLFANIGLKLTRDSNLSLHMRSDDHNTTERNNTYKININKTLNKINMGFTHSTGLRNPSLYELYGTDNYGIQGNINLNPEKSKVNEIFGKYNFSENFYISSTAYRSKIFDRIETNSAYSQHENKIIDLNQEGLENEIVYNSKSQSFSFFNNFSKSRKTNGQAQNRRPDLSYGAKYLKKFDLNNLGNFFLNINYKYTGSHIDYDGGNKKVKSTDIVNLSISKNFFENNFYINITNLFDENYEKPATYSQDGRLIRFGLRRSF
tara:strand:+ start:3674 stop:5527 length:1854 start_codon:yes stop_codon:yes gene_type:complete